MQRDLEARGGGMRRDKGVCLTQRNQSVWLRHFALMVGGKGVVDEARDGVELQSLSMEGNVGDVCAEAETV